jgi:hypothetical protein
MTEPSPSELSHYLAATLSNYPRLSLLLYMMRRVRYFLVAALLVGGAFLFSARMFYPGPSNIVIAFHSI